MEAPKGLAASAPYPRIVIKFCTQCKWMLRAAYVRARKQISFNHFPCYRTVLSQRETLGHVTTSLVPSYMIFWLAFWSLKYTIYIAVMIRGNSSLF